MTYEPVKVVHVYYQPTDQKIKVGRLALKSHKIFFEYDPSFLKLGLNLSPYKLPLKPGIIPSSDFVFDGLFGVFNDSLPDGWGRLLLDRALMNQKINPSSLTALDRLCFVGSYGMGALVYEPEAKSSPLLPDSTLDEIANEIREFQKNDSYKYVEDLLNLGGSSAGARPKVLLEIDREHWLIKFPSSSDLQDIGAIEYAYHLMAKEAGLVVPKAKLFPARLGPGFFGTKRFDRSHDTKAHMHSVSGLLHADHRVPCLDYASILKVCADLTKSQQECIKQFRLCVFNVLSHNRDDHSKNFSFLMDSEGSWQTSPSYDLTFSSGPSGEHCTMVMGEGKNPQLAHLLELAQSNNIKKPIATEIIEEVKSAVDKWPLFAKDAGVSQASRKLIESYIKSFKLP